jgi:hypothetical protein
VHALPRLDWRLAVKVLAGFAAGLALWVFLSPVYDRMIASVAAATMRAFEKPPVTRLRPAKDNFITVDRADFDPRSQRPAIPLRDLTFNVILLTALFAASKRTFSDRNIGGFIAAVVILALTHVLGAIAEVMSIYVAKLGMWSTVHYSDAQRTFWGVANHFYRLVLMYAIAFALWWVFRDRAEAGPARPGPRKKRR